MNRNLINRNFSGSFRGLVLLLMCLVVVNNGVLAQKKSSKLKPDIDLSFGVGTFYDDNILKYSEKYLERFMDNEDQGRFHIETYDDMIISTDANVTATFRFFGKLKTEIDVNGSYNHYAVNDVKSWGNFGFGLRQSITKKLDVKVFYDYIPEFYVRHFRDDDWTSVYGYTEEAFKPYIFSKDNFGAWADYTFFKNTDVRLYYYYSRYYHNEFYTEYDCKNNLYRIKITQPITKNFDIEGMYQFVTSDAKGYDGPGETKENSDDADATYVEDGFIFGLKWKMPRIKKRYHHLELETVIYNRYYQTDKPVEVDYLHAGRVDNNLRFYLTYYLSVSKALKFKAFYKWYGRDSGTTSPLNEQYVSDEKDYIQNQVGIEFTYKLGL